MIPSPIRILLLVFLPGAFGFADEVRPSLPFHSDRASAFDLAVTGGLDGVPSNSPRYLRYADIRKLRTAALAMTGEFAKGKVDLTVVFLADLWRSLPVKPTADCILATCSDGYASVFSREFIAQYRPFIVVEIDEKPPEQWSTMGLSDDPGPYAVTVSSELVPKAPPYLSIEHKKPWGVVSVEFASFAQAFSGAYSGKWALLGSRARAGRQIWINACASCHFGPQHTFSGSKSEEPFSLLAAIARGDPDVFQRYVLDPTSVRPFAKMPAHGYFTHTQLESLIAFIAAAP